VAAVKGLDAGDDEGPLVIGTPLYMAPEQVRAVGEADPATDVWALGVVLYELVAGVPPFHGVTAKDILTQVIRKAPASPCILRPDLPRKLESVILKCLEK